MGGTTHSSLSSLRREICAPEMQTLHTERQSGVQDSYRGRGNCRVVKLPDDEGWPGLSYSALAWLGLTCPSLALPPGRPARPRYAPRRRTWLDCVLPLFIVVPIYSQFAQTGGSFINRSHHLQRLNTGGIGPEHSLARSDLGTCAPVFQEKPTRLDIHKPSRLH